MCSLMHMTRKNILRVTEDVIKILKKEKELSIKSVSDKVGSEWRTALKSLEFLKGIGIVKERQGDIKNRPERLFSLNDTPKKYKK